MISARSIMMFLLSLSLAVVTACSSLNTKKDYAASRQNLSVSQVPAAADLLPNHERGSFISLMEKTYLSLLAGRPEIDELFRYSKKIDGQIQYKVTRDMGNMFYVNTPEDYYASEHEVIWMHFLLSWGFAMRGNYEDARVEAKVAANLLSMSWSPKGRFDDGFMRIMLSCLWMMSGDWEEARVDLRAAAAMSPDLRWAYGLAQLDRKPDNLTLLLCGCGPEPVPASGDSLNPLRKFRKVDFIPSGKKRIIIASADRMKNVQINRTTDSSSWYERHFLRNNEINNLIDDSKYGQRVGAAAMKAVGISTAGYLAGTAIILGGWGVAGGLVYLGAVANSGEVIGGGICVGLYGSFKGVDVIESTMETVEEGLHKDLDISGSYRYVRFLPEYAWVCSSNGTMPNGFSFSAKDAGGLIKIDESVVRTPSVNGVSVIFYPDSDFAPAQP